MMARAFLVVMDSVGCGGAPDAAAFGDTGANTIGHIAEACAQGLAEVGRSGPLRVPVLDSLGLGAAIEAASGLRAPGLGARPTGRWGAATEVSKGKDTPSGHWECRCRGTGPISRRLCRLFRRNWWPWSAN
jgi:phosphopentomutase